MTKPRSTLVSLSDTPWKEKQKDTHFVCSATASDKIRDVDLGEIARVCY